MKRKEIKNKSDFLNIGSCYLIYCEFDKTVINKIDLAEDIIGEVISVNLLYRWFNYFTLGIYDINHSLLCYITFYDDYVVIDLNCDLLYYNYLALQFIYYLFDDYYYYI